MHRSSVLTLALVVGLACQPLEREPGADSSTSDDTEAGDGDGDPAEAEGDGDGDADPDTGGPVFNCDPSEDMPCPDGQKCTVLESGSGFVYDCVPNDTSLLPFEECTPSPMDGQDECPTNHACIAPVDSQMG